MRFREWRGSVGPVFLLLLLSALSHSSELVEGSGSSDTEKKEPTRVGFNPDDEDSAVEGSGGIPAGSVSETVEGSGAPGGRDMEMTPSLVTSPPRLSTTSTTTPLPIIRIDELPTTAVVPGRASSTAATPFIPSSTRRPSAPRPTPPGSDSTLPFHTMLKPGIFAAVVGGTVVGVLMAILLVMFIVYRMRKRDEGSYALEEPKQRPYSGYAYTKASNSNKEFYA